MKTIKIKDKTILVDDEDFDSVDSFSWSLHVVRRKNYYAQAWIPQRKKPLPMHRFLFNDPPNMQIDHINRNGLDNRRSNLRKCTANQNQWNRKINVNNTSGFKGVRYTPNFNWRAEICFNNKTIDLGRFKKKEDAARAYNEKAVELFGEFANVNIL